MFYAGRIIRNMTTVWNDSQVTGSHTNISSQHSQGCHDPRQQCLCRWLTEKNYMHRKTGGLSVASMACTSWALQQGNPSVAFLRS